jgi:hypothetical protein
MIHKLEELSYALDGHSSEMDSLLIVEGTSQYQLLYCKVKTRGETAYVNVTFLSSWNGMERRIIISSHLRIACRAKWHVETLPLCRPGT